MKYAKNAPPLRVTVLVLNGANMLSLAAAVDPMRAANRMANRPLFTWTYATATGDPSRLTSGLPVPGEALSRITACDLLLIIASFELEQQDTPALRAGLRRIAASGARIAGFDGGPWLMATAGLLDRHNATTHWEDLDRFAARFPTVNVLPDRFHIDGARLTSGGAMPGLDMMLSLIATDFGQPLATRVAGAFIHDSPQNPMRQQSRAGGHPGHNAVTARASATMEQSLDAPLPLTEIARRSGQSPRSLQTQFRDRLNTTPQAHYLHLRLTEAMRLVIDTDQPLQDVALATGFASQSSFARAFKAAHGRSARDIRLKGFA
ncbi:GlxA family transcriptional regulator [Phaeobacter marinintestinus]|uniref:GlxA family transcriptional regulator n=1 Tax=Falsiphaeobacter marinintestinus TaxID=1492905 RepID=UPI0011B6BD03|nr:helix-turn-helix domain-containing protein [Phaeobacter marinintestinus]